MTRMTQMVNAKRVRKRCHDGSIRLICVICVIHGHPHPRHSWGSSPAAIRGYLICSERGR
jgi:hypothetical protein